MIDMKCSQEKPAGDLQANLRSGIIGALLHSIWKIFPGSSEPHSTEGLSLEEGHAAEYLHQVAERR